MFCSKCGNILIEGALFCSKCGERVYSVESTPSENPNSEEVVTAEETNDRENVSIDAVQQREVIATVEDISGREVIESLNEVNSEESVPVEDADNTALIGGSVSEESEFHESEVAFVDGTAEKNISVTLKSTGNEKVKIIKLVREFTGMGLKESKELVENAPALLKKDVTLKEAEVIKTAFMKDGADVTFTDQGGQSVEITAHCQVCGAVLGEGSNVCGSCGNIFDITSPYERNKVQNDPTLFKDDVDWKKDFNKAKEKGMRELRDKFKALSTTGQVIISLELVAIAGFTILLLVAIIRLVFLSFISIIVTAAGGYVIYHRWAAKWITEFSYEKRSKKLQLPEGMSAQTLLEALGGKFNYPYFKGVRYGEKGECVIEGKYSTYPVVFNEEGMAGLTYDPSENEKKSRTIMLEAIAIRNYINKFFNPTLPIDVVKDLKKMNLAERQRKAVSLVLGIASFLVIAMVALQSAFPGGLHNLLKPGAEVRNAYLSQYSNTVTIEEAFENFFENCKWKKYDSEGYSYVVFTGACEYLGKKADVKITFKITGENFIVDSLDLNGKTQSDLFLYGVLLKVYEEY